MTGRSTAPGQGAPSRARVLEFALLSVALVLPAAAYATHTGRWWVVVLHIGLVLPLFWRHRFPTAVFAIIAAVALVQWLTYQPLPSDAALLLALYTVASTGPLVRTLVAGGVLELGVLLVSIDHPGYAAKTLGFIFLSGLTTAAAVLGTNVQTRRAYLREVEERAARLESERDQKARLAVAGERTRVARDMHDIVAHNLAVMIALTDGAALTLETNPRRARTALSEASNAGRTALSDLRRVLGILRDTESEAPRESMPHLSALDQLVETVRHTGLDVRYRTTGPVHELPQAIQLSAYRVVQEAVTNVMKHARRAQVVTVGITATESDVAILVHDDGSTAGTPPDEGHGLVGIRERAALHHGSVVAGPTTTGWRVECRLRLDLSDHEGEQW